MDELSSCCGCVCVCGVGRGGGGGRRPRCEPDHQHAVGMHAIVTPRRGGGRWGGEGDERWEQSGRRGGGACERGAEGGGRDGHREGGKARQGEPVQGAHQSEGGAKSEWRQAEGGEEEGKGCVCGSEQVSLSRGCVGWGGDLGQNAVHLGEFVRCVHWW